MAVETGFHSKALACFALIYGLASLIHFTHNAEYLGEYPNLPAWLTRSQVYIAWLCVAAVGLVGYMLYRQGFRIAGLTVLSVYAAVGFDGLLHYGRAPFAAHTAIMNATIWFEVLAAGLLLITIVYLGVKHLSIARHTGAHDER